MSPDVATGFYSTCYRGLYIHTHSRIHTPTHPHPPPHTHTHPPSHTHTHTPSPSHTLPQLFSLCNITFILQASQPLLTDRVTVGQFWSLRADVQDMHQKLTACQWMLTQLVGGLLPDPNSAVDNLFATQLKSVEEVEKLQQQLIAPEMRKRAVSIEYKYH